MTLTMTPEEIRTLCDTDHAKRLAGPWNAQWNAQPASNSQGETVPKFEDGVPVYGFRSTPLVWTPEQTRPITLKEFLHREQPDQHAASELYEAYQTRQPKPGVIERARTMRQELRHDLDDSDLETLDQLINLAQLAVNQANHRGAAVSKYTARIHELERQLAKLQPHKPKPQ